MPIARILWLFVQSFITNVIFYGLLNSIGPALYLEIGEGIYYVFILEVIVCGTILGFMSFYDNSVKGKEISLRSALGEKAKEIKLTSWYADVTFACSLAINGYIAFRTLTAPAYIEFFLFAILGSLAISGASVVALLFLEDKRLGAIQATIQLLKPEAETE